METLFAVGVFTKIYPHFFTLVEIIIIFSRYLEYNLRHSLHNLKS